jgi:CRP-like cAMP-binding protein
VPEADRREVFLERVERLGLFAREMAESFVERFIDDFSACTRLMRHDERRGHGGFDVLLLRAAEVSRHYDGFPAMEEPLAETSDPTYGWASLSRGRVTVHSIPGTHETCVFPPHVGLGAAVLRAELARRAAEGRKLPSLPSLSATQWSAVLGKLQRHTLRRGDVLIEAGAADRRAFLVASGQLEVTRLFPGGGRHVREVGSGVVLGVTAFFDGKPRMATVRALSEVTACSLTPSVLDELVRVAPELAQTITADLARAVAATFRETVIPLKAARDRESPGASPHPSHGILPDRGPATLSPPSSLEQPA